MAISEDKIREALKQVVDPELFVNVIDLGLVYKIDVRPAAEGSGPTTTAPGEAASSEGGEQPTGAAVAAASESPAAPTATGQPLPSEPPSAAQSGEGAPSAAGAQQAGTAPPDASPSSASGTATSPATPTEGQGSQATSAEAAVSANGEKYDVTIEMTLTSPACPAGPQIVHNAKAVVGRLEGVSDVEVKLVMDPPWTPDRMTDDARDQLGIF